MSETTSFETTGLLSKKETRTSKKLLFTGIAVLVTCAFACVYLTMGPSNQPASNKNSKMLGLFTAQNENKRLSLGAYDSAPAADKEKIDALFTEFDTNKDGFLTKAEGKNAVGKLVKDKWTNMNLSSAELDAETDWIYGQYDQGTKDGKLSKDEIMKAYQEVYKRRLDLYTFKNREFPRKSLTLGAYDDAVPSKKEKIDKIFEDYDKSKDGQLDKEEAKGALKKLIADAYGETTANYYSDSDLETEVKFALGDYDTGDKDQKFNKDELMSAYLKTYNPHRLTLN